jgi:uncharacterized protein
MNLTERLMADLKEAMRNGDVVRRDTVRMVRAAIKNAEIDRQRSITDEEVLGIIAHEIKKRHESIEQFQQGHREDLVAKEKAELDVLQQYLPAQMSREQVSEVVQQIVTALGATGIAQLGPVMRQAMAQLKGKADGRLVNEVVREILSKS